MSQPSTLGNLLHECAGLYGPRTFITLAPSGKTWTYAQFEQLVNRCAHGLLDLVGAPPSHVAILLENGVQYLTASYALKKIDSVEVSINRTFRGAALARTIGLTRTPILITSAAHIPFLADIRDQLPDLRLLIVTDDPAAAQLAFPAVQVIGFEQLLAERDDHIESQGHSLSPAAIMFTSGTTGPSKGCQLSHRYAIRTAQNLIQPFRVTGKDVVYSPYPLSHIGPAYYDILPTMMTGGRLVLRDGFSLSNFWPEVAEFDVTWFMMLGSVQQLLWSAPESPSERLHKVSRCWATPAPVPKEKFDRRFNTHLIPGGGYGSTDAGWIVAPQWDHPGGRVLSEFEIAIVDELDTPQPDGTPGELIIRAREPGIMFDEYFGMPEATRASRSNGWFHTGDIAKIGEDGLFYFICRKAERIRVRGEMVSGFEVEEGILSHPDIEDCADIGVASRWGEEDIKVFLVLRPGKSLDRQAVRDHCRTRMAKHMVPVHIEFLAEIPRTPTGKVEKGKLTSLGNA